MKLVIVESPTKARTIGKYLGNEYKVVASQGHVRDLSTSGKGSLGVDIDNGFEPDYVVYPKSKKTVSYLQKIKEDADEVYLATDPDREGEAIAWHLADILSLDINDTKRLEFHEITKRAVNEALENARIIDMNLVKSQETRRILDRIIGFELSGLLQKKIYTRSAGRVQSVALKLVVDRQKEIEKFVEKISFGVSGKLQNAKSKVDFELVDLKLNPLRLDDQETLKNILGIKDKELKVKDIILSESTKYPRPPFTTSSLQQDAFTHFKFPASKTNKIAQKLYEGVAIANETTGLITYMRTDSIRLSDSFVYNSKDYIRENFGQEYVGFAKTQKENAKVQDAHEAIRPTRVDLTPQKVESYLSKDEFKIYKLIWSRAVSSIMKAAEVETTKVVLEDNNNLFLAEGSLIKFDGYKKVYSEFEFDKHEKLPPFEVDGLYKVVDVEVKEHKTKPPFKYSEGSLIKMMEELGIGRPSTYASTIDSLKKSGYVRIEKNYLIPTEIGVLASQKLDEFFADIINVEYTANMESQLDQIASGNRQKNESLEVFYAPFKSKVEFAYQNMDTKEINKTGEICPKCGGNLIKRKGKYGEFVGCENYPTCDYIKPKEKPILIEVKKCPDCKDGTLYLREGRFGQFLGCSNYPKCKHLEKINNKK